MTSFQTRICVIALLTYVIECTTDTVVDDVLPECTDSNTNSNECTSTNDNSTSKMEPNYADMDFSLDPSNYNYPYPCPGLAAGYECDYESAWSSRDGDHFFCDADVVHINDLTHEQFLNEYLFKKPLLIDANLSDWTDPSFWTKKNWLMKYGTYPFEAGRSLELVLNSGIGTVNITLEEYFSDHMQLALDADTMGPHDAEFKEPLYVFDRSIWREEEEFQLKHFHGPSYLFNTMEENYGILFIGVTGTGATWHAHGETWAGVAFGRKRWFLLPPEVQPPGGFWPGYSSKDWFRNIYPHLDDNLTWVKDTGDWNNQFVYEDQDKFYGTNDPINFGLYGFLRGDVFNRSDDRLNSESTIKEILSADDGFNHNGLHRPFECIQREGQLIYLPEFWWHAVLNIGDVAAAGIQSSESYSVWMKEIDYLGEIERLNSDKKQKKRHRKVLTDLEKQANHYDMLLIHDRLGQHAPFNNVHQFFVGYEYIDLGEYPLAEQYLHEALRMDPANIEAYLALSKIYRDSHDAWHNYLAETALRIAYILNHNHPTVRNRLIELFEEQERDDLRELVQKHKPLPNMIQITRDQLEEEM
eukprot:302925_1